MKKYGLEDRHFKILKEIFRDKKPYIFGSRIRGSHKKFSDIDLCLKEDISIFELADLEDKLRESDLPFKVDVVRFSKSDDDFVESIEKDLRLLF